MRKGFSYLSQYDEKTTKAEIERLHFACQADEENILQCLSDLQFTGRKQFLDLGSGPGSSTGIIHNFNKNGLVTGVDYEKEFIHYAQCYIEEQRMENVTFVEGNCEKLPFPDEQFDICFARFLFQHLLQPETVIQELLRVTKRGGMIGIYENDEGLTCYYPEPRHLHKFIEAKRKVRRFSGGDIFYGRKLYSLFCNNDFHDIRVRRLYRDIVYPGKEILAQSVLWNDDLREDHPYVQLKLMTALELSEYSADLQKLFAAPDAYIAYGGYFVLGVKN